MRKFTIVTLFLLFFFALNANTNQSYTEVVNGVEFDMVFVEGGKFENKGVGYEVGNYHISATEVTQELWEAVMGTTVAMQRDKINPQMPLAGVGDNHPIYYVSQKEAKEFCERLSRLTGRIYSLPVWQQWEYAALGGNKSHGYKYSGSDNVNDVAWINSESTHPVATKAPNELGIYDMSGNVYEWCDGAGQLRGGSWMCDASCAECNNVNTRDARSRDKIVGFRIVEKQQIKTKEGDNIEINLNGVRFKMVYVQGGTFKMGSNDSEASSNEKPVHSVTLSDFYIGETEVTQELWEAVMGTTVAQQRDKANCDWPVWEVIKGTTVAQQRDKTNYDWPLLGVGSNYPMYYISWDECQEFIRKLNQLTGKNFRLPTEAEWEYAARGGNKSRGYKYSGGNTISEVAWYRCKEVNDDPGSRPVGTKSPNELGIYNMNGNVWEWCSDWYHENYYSSSSQTNPTGPTYGSCRVFRGGCWLNEAQFCRIASRGNYLPSIRHVSLGLRLVCSSEKKDSKIKEQTISTDKNVPSKGQNAKNITEKVNGVSFKMIKVEGGTFRMGSNDSEAYSDEKPVHSVTLSDYYIGETEVTQELWEAVMGSNPSRFKGSKKPVEMVSWNDCQKFIKKLNELTGKNFRLPTEAEWEYAARGGNKSKGYKYSGSNNIDDVAWYDENACDVGDSSPDYGTHPVGAKTPNELGLYDMTGNVWEWCSDWYGGYSSSSQTNPTGPTSGSYRVERGGSWILDARNCRVAIRGRNTPDDRYYSLGLRLVCSGL